MTANGQKLTYYQRNKDAMLQRSKEYFEKNKNKRKEYQEIDFIKWVMKKKTSWMNIIGLGIVN